MCTQQYEKAPRSRAATGTEEGIRKKYIYLHSQPLRDGLRSGLSLVDGGELAGRVLRVNRLRPQEVMEERGGETEKETQTGRQADRQADRQTDIQTDRQNDRQTDIQTDRHTDRQTNRRTSDKQNKEHETREGELAKVKPPTQSTLGHKKTQDANPPPPTKLALAEAKMKQRNPPTCWKKEVQQHALFRNTPT